MAELFATKPLSISRLWDANDFEHRLKPKKFLDIITLSEKVLGIKDFEIEVEYQDTTIGKYDLEFNGENFELVNKQTACLAQDQCEFHQKNKNKQDQVKTTNLVVVLMETVAKK